MEYVITILAVGAVAYLIYSSTRKTRKSSGTGVGGGGNADQPTNTVEK